MQVGTGSSRRGRRARGRGCLILRVDLVDEDVEIKAVYSALSGMICQTLKSGRLILVLYGRTLAFNPTFNAPWHGRT